MPSFILRGIDQEFWSRVQAKAKAEGIQVKALILKLLAQWLGVVSLLLASTACAYHSPAAPTPPPQVSETAPFTMSLGATIGLGAEAGRAVVIAKVQNINGAPLADVLVTFTTDVGTIAPAQTPTDPNGTASSTVIAASTATVIAQAGSLTRKLLVVSEPAPLPSPSPPPFVPPPSPPPAPPTLPPPQGYTVLLAAAPTSLIVNGSATLTATVTPINGAPPATSYAWDCDGNGTPEITNSANTHSCAYPSSGTITSTVTVSSGTASGFGSTTVSVAAAAPLLVSIGTLTPTPAIGASVTFIGTVTSTGPPPTNALSWEWNFGESASSTFGVAESGTTPHSTIFATGYGSNGVKTITVRVTDPATGRVTTNSRTVTVP